MANDQKPTERHLAVLQKVKLIETSQSVFLNSSDVEECEDIGWAEKQINAVGYALLGYIANVRPRVNGQRVFLRVQISPRHPKTATLHR